MEVNVGPLKEDVIFKRKVIKNDLRSYNDYGIWRTRCNSELHTLYDELHIVKVIKIGRLGWLGYFFRMQELDPCSKLTLLKPDDIRRAGNP
jgi:hypothetical protein